MMKATHTIRYRVTELLATLHTIAIFHSHFIRNQVDDVLDILHSMDAEDIAPFLSAYMDEYSLPLDTVVRLVAITQQVVPWIHVALFDELEFSRDYARDYLTHVIKYPECHSMWFLDDFLDASHRVDTLTPWDTVRLDKIALLALRLDSPLSIYERMTKLVPRFVHHQSFTPEALFKEIYDMHPEAYNAYIRWIIVNTIHTHDYQRFIPKIFAHFSDSHHAIWTYLLRYRKVRDYCRLFVTGKGRGYKNLFLAMPALHDNLWSIFREGCY